MRFYNKVGRLTDDEQAVIQRIETLIHEKEIPSTELLNCENLDDLLSLQIKLEGFQQSKVHIEESHSVETGEKTIEEAPVSQSELSENKSVIDESSGEVLVETINDPIPTDPEEVNDSVGFDEISNELPISDQEPQLEFQDYDPFAEEIIERSYNKTEDKKTNISDTFVEALDEQLNLDEAKDSPIESLNPSTKKKVAEQTANALLKGYAKIVPQPFKWLAKIDEEKVEQMAFEGQIDISLEVDEGTTFDEYMKQANSQVDEIFEVEQDTLDEIREPLIEVLMEQEMELTPQQRLGMAIFSHLIQMLTVALKLRKQNNRILAYQKKITGMNGLKVA